MINDDVVRGLGIAPEVIQQVAERQLFPVPAVALRGDHEMTLHGGDPRRGGCRGPRGACLHQ